jgi:HTH-type transcriptional regulator/antitoxin HipB
MPEIMAGADFLFQHGFPLQNSFCPGRNAGPPSSVEEHSTINMYDMQCLYCINDNCGLSFLRDMKEFAINSPQQLGKVMRGFRKELRLSQGSAGAKVGLAQNAVSQIEADPGRAGLARVFKLMAALNLEIVLRQKEASSSRSEW